MKLLLLERKYGSIVKQDSHWDFLVKFTAVDVVVCLCVIFSGSFLCQLNCAHACMGMVRKISPPSQDTFQVSKMSVTV